MFDPRSHRELSKQIKASVEADRHVLDELRNEIRPLKSAVRRIQPRTATAVSLVGTDGGNNKLQFDPFFVQIIRVVDSSNNEYCLEAVTPTTSITALSRRQFDAQGDAITPLGKMMSYLGVKELNKLSPMIRSDDDPRPRSPSWVQVYREVIEWAILFDIIHNTTFGTDTIILYDGLLRSKVFSGDLFSKLREGIKDAIGVHYERRRSVYLAGIAKHSQVYTRYRLAMMLEGIMVCDYPCYLEIPRDIEAKAYLWPEYARDDNDSGGEINKFVGGKMFFAKFGNGKRDPIWPIDIFSDQVDKASTILGCMLADAVNGFPVPLYPLCLQKAHENAALVDFDFDILQDQIYEAVRSLLGDQGPVLDTFELQDIDPAAMRYS